MAASNRAVGDVPSHGVRVCQPSHERRHLAFLARVEEEVPVIAHHAPAENPNRMQGMGLDHDSLEGLEVCLLAKQRKSGNRTVQHVINQAARGYPCSSWHEPTIAETSQSITSSQKLAASPFRHPFRHPVSTPRCLRLAVQVTHTPRKTRFRLLVRLCRTGLSPAKAPLKGFSYQLPITSPFPELLGAMNGYGYLDFVGSDPKSWNSQSSM